MKNFYFTSLITLAFMLIFNLIGKAQTDGTLTFSFTPIAHSGSYGAKHTLAVWIQDNSDAFVKTKFRYWGNNTNDHLPIWKTNSNQNVVDAVTGATLTSYGTKSFTWDATNTAGTIVDDGDYKITLEECWSHGSSKTLITYTFSKSGTEVHLTPTDNADFKDVTIDWVPVTPATSITNIEEDNSFSIYPNPTKDNININFSTKTEKCDITIVNYLGEVVYENNENQTSDLKNIDISNLNNGLYFINIDFGSKKEIKKFVVLR